jgi:hypothetical protein
VSGDRGGRQLVAAADDKPKSLTPDVALELAGVLRGR